MNKPWIKKNAVFCLLALLVLLAPLSYAAGKTVNSEAQIQIVESVPLETDLGSPDVPKALDVWLDMINGAKMALDIEQFYVSNKKGEPLEKVIDAITNAAARGVKVRIIADKGFYKTYPETLDALGKIPNIAVRLIDFHKAAGGVQHSKFFVVDCKEVFVGSQNFDWRALIHIHEIGARVKNVGIAGMFLKIFDLDWAIANAKDKADYAGFLDDHPEMLVNANDPVTLKIDGKNTAVVYPSFSPKTLLPKGLDWDEDELLKLMNGAKKEIVAQVLSYSPLSRVDNSYYAALDNAIRSAACRGVKVKLIFSDWSTTKPKIDFIKSLALAPGVEIKISTIPPYSKGFIDFARVEHCKYMVVDDDLSWVGTANWEKSYFYNTRNASLIIKSTAVSSQLKKIFFHDWDGPYTSPVDVTKDYRAPKVSP